MSTRIATAFLLCVVFATPGFAGPLPSETAQPAYLTKRVPPNYPAQAVERGQEGWADVRFTITPEGTTSGARVIASYPGHVFARSAINAVNKWEYTPRMENGVAVPQGNNRAVLSFALRDSTAIRDAYLPQFTAARDAVNARQWDAADKLFTALAENNLLTLYELATLEELRGRVAFGQQQYALADDCLARSLAITSRFAPEARGAIAALLVMAALNAGDHARGVELYDLLNLPADETTRDLRRAVETARAALAAGRAVNLAPLRPAD